MSDVKWIKIAVNIFDNRKIKQIEKLPEGDRTILTWFYLMTKSKKLSNGSRVFMICDGYEMTDDVLQTTIYPCESNNTKEHIERLEGVGLVKRMPDRILVYDFNNRDRNSSDYVSWRKGVFMRDVYTCVDCGSKKSLQAHHIISWTLDESVRYELTNGVTLCRSCHLKRHGGNWKNG